MNLAVEQLDDDYRVGMTFLHSSHRTETSFAEGSPCSFMNHKKVILVLVDGLGDTGHADLQATPLQQAVTPTLNKLCGQGFCGLMDPVAPGLACGSDTAHLSIFGYDPRLYYHGRGAFESMGAGLEMSPGDVAFKSNFAVIRNEDDVVTSRRADRRFEDWGISLCEDLCGKIEDVEVTLKYATEHRCGVRLRGPGLSGSVSGTDPLKDNLKLKTSRPLEDSEESRKTARIVNLVSDYLRQRLETHPLIVDRRSKGLTYSNCILLRGAGHCAEIESFESRHGLKPFMIAPTAIIAGLGITLGFDRVCPPGATGDYHTNLNAKAEALVETFFKSEKDYKFGFLHVKAVDDAGHDKNWDLKVKFIEKVEQMVAYLLDLLGHRQNEFIFVLTGDHTTPVSTGDHSFEPVPFMICDLGASPQTAETEFDEISCGEGDLGRFRGSEVMNLIKNFIEESSS
eukprot:TRINITY_DN12883_c0_g1_i2.p1 TRINITY_DN12883_c0_g1~~TRINITY_DN12883_c0_g1_i2.p1  ORF type:complete len:454 (-),score=118.01 TRINITY_DN12883_c0_g1_i2:59-1420(-)